MLRLTICTVGRVHSQIQYVTHTASRKIHKIQSFTPCALHTEFDYAVHTASRVHSIALPHLPIQEPQPFLSLLWNSCFADDLFPCISQA